MAKNVSDAFFLWYPLLVACGLLAGAGVVQGYYLASNWSQNQPSAHAEESAALISRDSHTTDDDERSAEDERAVILAKRARGGDWDDDLVLEQLTRNASFLTPSGLQKLRSAFIVVVGCGGVGSHATAALARSGAGKIRLVDFDQITLSSLNRHSVATLADVGTSKVSCLMRRLQHIVPWVQFDVRNELFSAGSAGHLLEPWSSVPTRDDEQGQRISYVVDAIDNIDSKVLLLQHCHQNHLPVISTMGAGLKSDPTRIMVGDISTTNEDPLSRAVRIRLRKLNINNGFPCVFSTETAGIGKATLTPLTDEQLAEGSVDELSILPNFRIRILPVLGTMPSIFGNTAANHVILEIAGYPHDYLPFKSKQKMWDGILSKLQGSEERLARNFHGNSSQGVKLGIAINDVGFLVEEIYRGRSVLSQQTSKLNLIRWARPKDGYLFKPTVDRCERVSNLALEDVVLLSSEEAAIHEKRILEDGELTTDVYSSASCRLVQTKQGEAKKWNSYR